MGQIEIYEYLKAQALGGRHEWVTAKELSKVLGLREYIIHCDLVRLNWFGYLEWRRATKWANRGGHFKLLRKYVKAKI